MTPQVYTALLPGGAAAVMDIRTGRGQWRHLNATAAALWTHLTEGVPLAQALDVLCDRFTDQGADRDIMRTDLAALAAQLHATGLLDAHLAPTPSLSRPTVRLTRSTTARPAAADRAAGLLGLVTALALLRCAPIRSSVALAASLARRDRPTATAEQADHLSQAVRRAGRLWPGRVACLEESLAVYLAAQVRGRRVVWVIGARTAPAAAHAWTEAGGEVIGQDLADRLWPYAPALRI
ncbi:lasso peptide biosynthesis B2 protein (plasmid) [Streptomyces scopuliridis]|uniref:lasso peptide biosynthesis B2 protein n=1 Tax=Streptomyces scopuliridis TaxID=452529 RepID=UPI002DD8A947|nr:lasso peptide biosynthesis B2 protein [Streptomyces scopuliridis]WSB39191.1 lasso peptide biosynthesis B2 protein [Streptomyces scopuliridis]